MKLTLDSLRSHLSGEPARAYLVSGDEALLVGEAADAIRARVRRDGFEREVHFIERVADWEAVRASHWRNHPAGEDLIREGTADEHFYILASGLLKVTQRGKLLNAVSPGECVGEMAYARREGQRSATVTAVEPSWAMRLRVQDVDTLSESARARFTSAFLAIMAERLAMLGGRLVAMEPRAGVV